MTGAAVLTVIATILAVGPGTVEIDLGRNGGLQAGDEGTVLYEIGVGNEVRSIEVGKGTVTEASGYTAKLQVLPSLEVRSGYLVRFEIPVSRVGGGRSADHNRDPGPPEGQSESLPQDQLEAFVTNTDGSCLNVRPLPATVMPPIACISEGARVVVIDTVSDWKKARLSDGREGWVATQFLSAKKPSRTAERAQPREPMNPLERALQIEPTREPLDPVERALQLEPAPEAAALDETEFAYETNPRAAELANQLRATDSEVNALLEQTSRGHDALSEAERRQTDLRRRLLETTVSDLEARIGAARRELAQSRSERSNLMAQITELEANQRRLEGALEDTTAAETVIAAEAERLRAQFTETQSKYETARAEQSRLEQELETSRSSLAQLEAVAEAAKEALRNEIRKSETTAAALHEQLAAQNARIATLEAERQTMAAQVGEAETGLSWWRSRRELKRTKRALREAELARAQAESQLAEVQARLPEDDARIAELTKERNRLAAIVERLDQADPTDAGQSRADIEAELADARYHIAEVEIQLGERQPEDPPPLLSGSIESGEIEDLSTEMTEPPPTLVVLESASPCLNFRADPSLDGKVFECLDPGTALAPVGRWQGWHYVELADRRAGWVSGQHVGPMGMGGGGDVE